MAPDPLRATLLRMHSQQTAMKLPRKYHTFVTKSACFAGWGGVHFLHHWLLQSKDLHVDRDKEGCIERSNAKQLLEKCAVKRYRVLRHSNDDMAASPNGSSASHWAASADGRNTPMIRQLHRMPHPQSRPRVAAAVATMHHLGPGLALA